MGESNLITVIGALLSVLLGLISWVGNRIFMRLDSLMVEIQQSREDHLRAMAQLEKDHAREMLEIHKAMKAGDDVLHNRVTGACDRISKIEAVCNIQHKVSQ